MKTRNGKIPLPEILRISALITFIKEHRFFSLFFITLFTTNILIIIHGSPEVKSLSSSTYDRGPYGTYAFFEHLRESWVEVKRAETPVFNYLKNDSSAKTLLILSPVHTPQAWEWEQILEWVAQGNRLITSGITAPGGSFLSFTTNSPVRLGRIPVSEVDILLPVHRDSPLKLPPDHQIGTPLFGDDKREPGDTILVSYFNTFTEDMVPFLSMDQKVIGIKRSVGKGEWVLFTQPNPFSNTILTHQQWHQFAVTLLAGDSRFSNGEIIFNEYHNGYKASDNLWGLLRFYRFDHGIMFLCGVGLLFLVFTGIRISPPTVWGKRYAKDVLPGLKAMANLLCRHKAYGGLLRRELELIKGELTGKRGADVSGNELYDLYIRRKGALPPHTDVSEFIHLIDSCIEEKNPARESTLKTLNLFVHIRKDLQL